MITGTRIAVVAQNGVPRNRVIVATALQLLTTEAIIALSDVEATTTIREEHSSIPADPLSFLTRAVAGFAMNLVGAASIMVPPEAGHTTLTPTPDHKMLTHI